MVDARYENAKNWVSEVGNILRNAVHNSGHIDKKTSHQDVVSKWDKVAEQKLKKLIFSSYPQDDIVAEESYAGERHRSQDVWYLDPIDGTTNFINQKMNFAVSLAYYRNGQPIFGIVLDVMAKQMYHACIGRGAYKNLEKLNITENRDQLNEMLLTTPMINHAFLEPHDAREGLVRLAYDVRGVRSLGSVALELCLLAESSSIFVAMKSSPWDHNAAGLILSEAGGAVRLLNGMALEADSCGPLIACSNSEILKMVLRDYIDLSIKR